MVLDLIEKMSFHLVMDVIETIIFGADMSSSIHANSKTKNISVLGKYLVQGLYNTTIYAEKLYSINFTENCKKTCLSLLFACLSK